MAYFKTEEAQARKTGQYLKQGRTLLELGITPETIWVLDLGQLVPMDIGKNI